MLVMAVDVDSGSPLSLLLIGLTMQDIEDVIADGKGVGPVVNVMEVLHRVSLHKMPGAVQIIIGADNEAIEEQVRAALPHMAVYDMGCADDDPETVEARKKQARDEHNAAYPPNINGPNDAAAAAAIRSEAPGLN